MSKIQNILKQLQEVMIYDKDFNRDDFLAICTESKELKTDIEQVSEDAEVYVEKLKVFNADIPIYYIDDDNLDVAIIEEYQLKSYIEQLVYKIKLNLNYVGEYIDKDELVKDTLNYLYDKEFNMFNALTDQAAELTSTSFDGIEIIDMVNYKGNNYFIIE